MQGFLIFHSFGGFGSLLLGRRWHEGRDRVHRPPLRASSLITPHLRRRR
jgi:hypothetical protein